MSAKIYIEGGGDSKELHIRCREAFRRLLEKCNFKGRMPRLIACGGRGDTFEDFKTACQISSADEYVALLVDSEEALQDIEQPWVHLNGRDRWIRPAKVRDEQALLMTTCMETWIASDRDALRKHYGGHLREKDLPDLHNMEERSRHDIQNALVKATQDCRNRYQKGKRSFEVLAALTPDQLRKHLPSFRRFERVLNSNL